jgi:hypothetical protein
MARTRNLDDFCITIENYHSKTNYNLCKIHLYLRNRKVRIDIPQVTY